MDFASIDDLWSLHDSYTVQQAAALIAGFDPSVVCWNLLGDVWFENEHGWTENEGANRVKTSFSALVNAINGMTLTATIRRDAKLGAWYEYLQSGESTREVPSGHLIFKESPNWSLTTITRTDLVKWLHLSGKRKGFFFPDSNLDTPGYLNPGHPRYPPKLAAVVRAWEAVTDPKGKSPRQALEQWLREHAADFRLTGDDGNPVNLAIQECSKVANWSNGGAPRTPG